MSKGTGNVGAVDALLLAFDADISKNGLLIQWADGDKALEPALTISIRAADMRRAELNKRLSCLSR